MALFVSLAAASIGGLKVGFDLGVLNPCMEYVSEDLSLADYQEGLVMVLLIVSAAVGALGAGRVADSAGLISAQNMTALLGALGSALSAWASGPGDFWIMSTGRLIAGLGCGACTVIFPRYIAEISPPTIRGALSCATQVSICLGLLVSYLLGLPYELNIMEVHIGSHTLHWWRAAHIIGVLISISQLIMLMSSVESPAWLEYHGAISQAQAARNRLLREADRFPNELPLQLDSGAVPVEPLLPTIQEEALSRTAVSLDQILATPQYRFSSFLAISATVLQQLSGINTVILYSASILTSAGYNSPILGTVLVGLINVTVSLCTAGLVDRHGRRIVLLVSHAGCALSLTILALADLEKMAQVELVAMLGFVASFGLGSGPVPFMYMSEVLSPDIKGLVASVAMAGNWTCNVVVVGLFPMAAAAYGVAPTYCVFVVFNIVAVAFCLFVMVETKQLSMKEIQEAILKRAW